MYREYRKLRDRVRSISVGGMIILTWILQKMCLREGTGLDWPQDRNQGWDLVIMVVNVSCP
jgi:hypothetical protein